jgi:tetratricopeptide (TPR) repeat protein
MRALLGACLELGQALRTAQRIADAQRVFRGAVELGLGSPAALNNVAWQLATDPEAASRDPLRAVALASKAVEQAPMNAMFRNTLGVAYYRAGKWGDAVAELEKSVELQKGGTAFDFFFLAMAHWQLDHKPEARQWHEKAVAWGRANAPDNEELQRFREEAAQLIRSESERSNLTHK